MYAPIKSTADCESLQRDLDHLHEWEDRWQMRFNVKKCNVLRATHATKKQIVHDYTIGGTLLEPTHSTTYLGVELSSDLKWNSHVDKVAAKGNQMLGVLRRNLKQCPKPLKEIAYKTLLRPKLEYATTVWDPYTKENIGKIERVQRRSARFVCNNYGRTSSVSEMLTSLEWPLLEQRRAEARLSMFHRMVNDGVDIDQSVLMTAATRNSRRGHQMRYIRHHTRKDCHKYSFIPRTIVQWNNLSGEVVEHDLPQFKSLIRNMDLTLGGDSYKY